MPGAPTCLSATRGNGQVALDLVGARLERRLADHRLHRDRQPRRRDLLDAARRLHGHRPDQRHELLVHRHRDQRRRHRPRLERPLAHDPGDRARRADLSSAHAGQRQVALVWSAPASNGGIADHRLHRDREPRRRDLHRRPAPRLHVSGLTNGTATPSPSPRRTAPARAAPSNALVATPAPRRARRAEPARRHARQRPGGPRLDRAGLQRRLPITGYTATASPGGATCSTGEPAARSPASPTAPATRSPSRRRTPSARAPPRTRCRKGEHARHPSPLFRADLQALLYARSGDRDAHPIDIGDDRQQRQHSDDAVLIFIWGWIIVERPSFSSMDLVARSGVVSPPSEERRG